MTSYDRNRAQFSPRNYPEPNDNNPPIPPNRSDIEQPFLPQPPPRGDKPVDDNPPISREKECSCNYNSYATKKTIGTGLLEFALLTSNAMQLKTLVSQKQHDGIWVASLVLVCASILAQFSLAYLLILVGKGNIQDPQKQTKLERLNNIVLFLTVLVSGLNIVINAFMSTTNTNSYLDKSEMELLAKNKT